MFRHVPGLVLVILSVAASTDRTASGTDRHSAAVTVVSQTQFVSQATEKPVGSTTASPGSPAQPADDETRPFEPSQPQSDEDQKKVEARAWYMTGRMRQQAAETADDEEARKLLEEAWKAYRKAVELNPKAVEVYRELVRLALDLGRPNDAIQYAEKAVELDPSDFMALRQLGVYNIERNRFNDALPYFEKALKSDKLDHKSAFFVLLNRDLAILYSGTGQVEKAADAYEVLFDALVNTGKYDLDFRTRQALANDGEDGSVTFERIGQTFIAAGRSDQAIRVYQHLERIHGGRPGSHNYSLAKLYFESGQNTRAETELGKYLDAELTAQGRDAYQLLADILKAENRDAEVLPALEVLAKKDPRNSTLQYYLAERYVVADRLPEAEQIYAAVLKGDGGPEGHLGLAGIYRRQGNSEKLLDALINAFKGGVDIDELAPELETIAETPQSLDAIIAVGRQRMNAEIPELDLAGSYILARLAADKERIDDARAFYQFALDGKPAPELAMAIHMEWGTLLLQEDLYKEAADVFDAGAHDPAFKRQRGGGLAMMLFRLSHARELNGETDKALEAVVEARRIVPDAALLHYQEGWIYYHSRQWDTAIEKFTEVMKTFADDKETLRRCQFSLSNIFVQQGNIKRGEEILEEVLAEEPDDPAVNNDLGYLYADQGKNLEQAESMIRKAVAAEPENAAYLDSMGWVLFRREKYEEAAGYLKTAAESPTGGDATIFEHLGDCYEKLGRMNDARESWEKALKATADDARPDAELVERLKSKTSAAAAVPPQN